MPKTKENLGMKGMLLEYSGVGEADDPSLSCQGQQQQQHQQEMLLLLLL